MKTYLINSECGIIKTEANDIDHAKAIYSETMEFDFDNIDKFPGSWYAIYEDGSLVETVNPENAG